MNPSPGLQREHDLFVHRAASFGFASFAVLLLLGGVSDAAITRGPYLQSCSSTSVVVRWRTDAPAIGAVRFGSTPTSLNVTATEAALTVEHEIRVTGLMPDAKYFYAVEAGGSVLASGTNYFFVTAPQSTKATRIWVIGDAGNANSAAAMVRDSYYAFAQGRDTDVWLMLGDNAYGSGTDAEHQRAIFDFFPELLRNTCFWPALGNHDTATEAGGLVFEKVFSLPSRGESGGVPSNSELYYAFNYGNIHFIVLDSERSDRSPSGPMLTWLQWDLAAADSDWLIAFWHHPPYTKGILHDSDIELQLIEMRENVLPILEHYGVDLVLAGHTHAYERSFLLNGHYGFSSSLTPSMKISAGSGRTNETGAYVKSHGPNQGTVYVVAGSSSRGGDLDFPRHPAMYFSDGSIGSLVINIDGNRLDARMLAAGTPYAISDHFTIIKTGTRHPSINMSRRGNELVLSWPTRAIPFQLQNATMLAGSTVWNIPTNAVVISNGQHVASFPVTTSNHFFRLCRPPLPP